MKEKNEPQKFRSSCALSSGLDLFGDKWSLLIVRDLLYYKERTFKDFSSAKEHISSARLANRLSRLEQLAILTKNNHPTNKKQFIYKLTPKGFALTPIIAECMNWAYTYLPDQISERSKQLVEAFRADREKVLNQFNHQ